MNESSCSEDFGFVISVQSVEPVREMQKTSVINEKESHCIQGNVSQHLSTDSEITCTKSGTNLSHNSRTSEDTDKKISKQLENLPTATESKSLENVTNSDKSTCIVQTVEPERKKLNTLMEPEVLEIKVESLKSAALTTTLSSVGKQIKKEENDILLTPENHNILETNGSRNENVDSQTPEIDQATGLQQADSSIVLEQHTSPTNFISKSTMDQSIKSTLGYLACEPGHPQTTINTIEKQVDFKATSKPSYPTDSDPISSDQGLEENKAVKIQPIKNHDTSKSGADAEQPLTTTSDQPENKPSKDLDFVMNNSKQNKVPLTDYLMKNLFGDQPTKLPKNAPDTLVKQPLPDHLSNKPVSSLIHKKENAYDAVARLLHLPDFKRLKSQPSRCESPDSCSTTSETIQDHNQRHSLLEVASSITPMVCG